MSRGELGKVGPGDARLVDEAVQILAGTSSKHGLARILPFLGPAFVASVAYMDPGNWATNIQAGSKFGYLLLWVIVVSNLMAMLVQTLSAKLGIATGMNLAEHCRARFPRPASLAMWVVAEIVAMATDLAEFLGAAIGFHLLLGVPLWMGGVLTGITTLAILSLERYGFRVPEAIITSLVGIIAVSYVIETILDRPDWGSVFHHAVTPTFSGPESVLLATGILGATVMPHVVYLHSALTQGRIVVRHPDALRKLFRYEVVDVVVAMGLAGFVNAAMLIMAAATFFRHGLTDVGTIEEAYRTLQPLLGSAASWIFALALLASGLSSSTVGTMSGQVVMQGFVHWKISLWVRRLLTMAPSMVVIFLGLDPTRTLVISQVVLSFGLPFAVIPLVIFTARRDMMGVLTNRPYTTLAAGIVAGLVVMLNLYLLYVTFLGG
jgi:manganese transport protein